MRRAVKHWCDDCRHRVLRKVRADASIKWESYCEVFKEPTKRRAYCNTRACERYEVVK